MKKNILIGLAMLALFAAGWFTAAKVSQSLQTPATPDLNSSSLGGDFSLYNSGKTYKLSDFSGKLVVMYFGYTSCPDVCPTTLGVISLGLKALTPEQMAQVQPIFISVDSERDSVDGEKLMKYAQHFNPSFIGLSGTNEQVSAVTRQYGAFYAKVKSNSALGYLVDHTSRTYLIDKKGKPFKVMPHDMTPEQLTEAIQAALSGE